MTRAAWAAKLMVEGRVFVLMPDAILEICKALVRADAQISYEVDRAHVEALEMAKWASEGENPARRALALTSRSVTPCTCGASPNRLPHQRDEGCQLFTDGIKVT